MDRQTLKLLARIAENLPDMTPDVMQWWIDNPKGLQRVLASALVPPCLYREVDGVFYVTVTSDGTTGEGWITRLESKGFRVGDYTKQVLRSPDFKPTSGITTELVILPGTFFSDSDRITKQIRATATARGLSTPNAEVACLLRELLSDDDLKAMGLTWIVAMHEPINDAGGDPGLLSARRDRDGRWLYACYDLPGHVWSRDRGFAFVASQA